MTKYGEEDLDILIEPSVRMPGQGLRKRSPVFIIFTTIARLILPVAALLGVFALLQFAESIPITLFDRYPSDQAELNLSNWLTGAHFAVPLSFFVIHLTNRAFGAGLALGQVLIAWILLTVGTLYYGQQITAFLPWWETQPQGATLGFAVSLFVGHLTAVAVFNMTRGPIWWKAPLYGGIFGAAVFVGLNYTIAPLEAGMPFSLALATDSTINFTMAVLLLLPYWMLRPIIRPLPGYGGA